MSAMRKFAVSAAGLFIGIVGILVTVPAGNAVADDHPWDGPGNIVADHPWDGPGGNIVTNTAVN